MPSNQSNSYYDAPPKSQPTSGNETQTQYKKKFRARGSRGRGSTKKHAARMQKQQHCEESALKNNVSYPVERRFTAMEKSADFRNQRNSAQVNSYARYNTHRGNVEKNSKNQVGVLPNVHYSNIHHVTPTQPVDYYWQPDLLATASRFPPMMPSLEHPSNQIMQLPNRNTSAYEILPPPTSSMITPITVNPYPAVNTNQQILPPLYIAPDTMNVALYHVPNPLPPNHHQTRERFDTGTTFVSLSSSEGAPALSIASSGSFDFEPILPNLSSESQPSDKENPDMQSLSSVLPQSNSLCDIKELMPRRKDAEKIKNGYESSSYCLKLPPLEIPRESSFEKVRKYREQENEGSLFDVSPRSFLMGRAASKRLRPGF